MSDMPNREPGYPQVTDGEIAFNNLESARRSAWSRFRHEPHRLDIAECIVELENFTAQFSGDLSALDRLETLVSEIDSTESAPEHTALTRAQVASTLHRFAEARGYLAKSTFAGRLGAVAHRLSLSVDQACGDHLESVLESRRQMAETSGRLEDLVPLGALVAELGRSEEADQIYARALREYDDVSPFAVAWVCFQRGVLWGELAPEPQAERAAYWYRKAIDYLPCYAKARVHLSEICLSSGDASSAVSILLPVISSGDPEVQWRLADALSAMGETTEAARQLEIAHSSFEVLLKKHLLAFADHGAEFYAGNGHDPRRALELATINVANRPTRRAFQLAYTAAIEAREPEAAAEFLLAARERWGRTHAVASWM